MMLMALFCDSRVSQPTFPKIRMRVASFARGPILALQRATSRAFDTPPQRLFKQWLTLATLGVAKTHVAALTDPNALVPYRAADRNFHGGEGIVVRHGLLNEDSRQASKIQLWTLLPGASEGVHVHLDEGMEMPKDAPCIVQEDAPCLEELYICLRGSGSVNLIREDGTAEDVPFVAGDVVNVPAGLPHGVTNTDAHESLQCLIMWGPPAS